jgi:hypothetical protein
MPEKYITKFKSDGLGSLSYDHTNKVLKMQGRKPKVKAVKELFRLLTCLIKDCKNKGREYAVSQIRKD